MPHAQLKVNENNVVFEQYYVMVSTIVINISCAVAGYNIPLLPVAFSFVFHCNWH